MTPRLKGQNCKFFKTPPEETLEERKPNQMLKNDQKA